MLAKSRILISSESVVFEIRHFLLGIENSLMVLFTRKVNEVKGSKGTD